MPFTLTPFGFSHDDATTDIRGRLTSGAYSGPEAVRILSADGRELAAHICSHGMESLQDWPVQPEHETTVLILSVPRLPAGFVPVSVIGLGRSETTHVPADISHLLTTPEFWAIPITLHAESDEVDCPELEFLGITTDRLDRWYVDNLQALWAAGRSPYVRTLLPGSRYVELEMAGECERENRIWIGRNSGPERVLLGYHSGHFSLPALRQEEVERMALESETPAMALFWLCASYLAAGQQPLKFIREVASKIPGVREDRLPLLAECISANLTVESVSWSFDVDHGWTNNSIYSQRNPESKMSVLTPVDFAFIREFFAEVT